MRHLPAILLAAGVAAFVPVLSSAQQADSEAPAGGAANEATSAGDIFARAQRLMAAGQEESGRALVQGELNAAPPGSARYVEALYWRAVLAATAADAERDLRTIIIEYPLSQRSDDALMRLAQLEMTRGENDQALEHLDRVVREHPHSASRPRASFWMARVLFDMGDAPRACARLADARATTPAAQVELHNQIEYLAQRCVGVDTSAAAVKPQRSPAPRTSAPVDTPRAPRAAPAPPAAHELTAQVAAFSTRDAAEHLRDGLRSRGYDARVTGSEPPYRVRIGRYGTREAADSAAAQMRARNIDVYVTAAEPRK
ncbi:MAG TPA: SPOR domain-containing protein [Gemmatimonadaceae bacterium]